MIQEQIYTAISGDGDVQDIVGSKIYPIEAPQGIAAPYVVYELSLDDAINSLDGDSGLDVHTLTVHSWATSYKAAHELASAVRDALIGTAGIKIVTISQEDERDFETENFCVVSQFSIWSTFDGDAVSRLYEIIEFIIDGHGRTIQAGASGHKTVPWDCAITKWEVIAAQTGSIQIDIKKSTYSAYPTFTSIAGTEKPTLSSAKKNTDASLTSFQTSLSRGDRIQALVDSADLAGPVVLTLYVTKS